MALNSPFSARLDRRSSSSTFTPFSTAALHDTSTSDEFSSTPTVGTLSNGTQDDASDARLDRHSSSSTFTPSPTAALHNTSTTRDESSSTPTDVGPFSNGAQDDASDARLDRRSLSSSNAASNAYSVTRVDRILPPADADSLEFPNIDHSLLPPWLSGPVLFLAKEFTGCKELSVVRGLVAWEFSLDLVR